jgi:hypothetical protein
MTCFLTLTASGFFTLHWLGACVERKELKFSEETCPKDTNTSMERKGSLCGSILSHEPGVIIWGTTKPRGKPGMKKHEMFLLKWLSKCPQFNFSNGPQSPEVILRKEDCWPVLPGTDTSRQS